MGRFNQNYNNSNDYDAVPVERPTSSSLQIQGSSNTIQAMYATNPAIAREVATVQCQMLIAQSCPRNMELVQERVEAACSRLQLASSAIYAYAKGGTDIQGPSIRLAEALINAYGNSKAGFEVTAQGDEESTVRAYAFDMETNTLMERTFVVSHWRHTKKGDTLLTDPREIYETVANNASRRVRACILAIIPSDLQEFAVQKCTETLARGVNITPDTLTSLVEAFSSYGVTKPQIEKYIQRKLEAITTSQYLKLKQIYAALRDGMGVADDYFEPEDVPAESENKAVNASNEEKRESVPTQEKNAVQSEESSPEKKTASDDDEEMNF